MTATVEPQVRLRPCEGRLLRKFDECRTAFLCCDIQEKTRNRIPNYHHAVHVSNLYARFHERLPAGRSVFIVTEQYPQGVGPTAHDIQLPADAHVFSKMEPSMLTEDVLPFIIGDAERGIEPVQQVVLWGHETHVCIIHTADALLQLGIRVAVSIDGCAAQGAVDHQASMMAMSAWPGLLPTTVTSVFIQVTKNDDRLRRDIFALLRTVNDMYATESGETEETKTSNGAPLRS